MQALPSDGGFNRYASLDMETSFVLHGMLALSSRFSRSSFFQDLPSADRGKQFGTKAIAIYHASLRSFGKPTLRYLQGCILLAFYLYSSGPDSQAWLMVGTCSRLAYDLGLNKVDEQVDDGASCPLSPHEWSDKEELRRAWWGVWEMDTFASAVSCRPHTIDSTKMEVKMPVSDCSWFADSPIQSTIIDPDPLKAWYCLRNCENQNEWAWFLVINYLLVVACNMGQERTHDPQKVQDIENAVACYALLLPQRFHLQSGSLTFSPTDFVRSNWIISTNIMLEG